MKKTKTTNILALIAGTEDSVYGRLCWHSGRAVCIMFFVQMLRGSTYVNDAGGDTRRLTKLSPHLDISTVNEEKEHAQLSFQLEKTKVYDTS